MKQSRANPRKSGWLLIAGVALLVIAVFARRVIQRPAGGNRSLKRGESVYYKHCSVCHSPDTDTVVVGPSLKNYFQRPPTQLSNGTLFPRTDAAIRDLLQHGTRDMPPISQDLSEQDTADLLVFLHTL